MNKSIVLKPSAKHSYKIGVDEIEGLKEAMQSVMIPVRDALRAKAYWNESLDFGALEYKSRDGFIPYSHNFGGVEIGLIVPQCEEHDWGFLEFGELTEEYTRDEDPYENEGELDAYLRIILKFEGFDDSGNMQFYLNVSGGNNDAPYFRVSNLPDLFEAEFTCRTVKGLKRVSSKHIKNIVNLISDKAVSNE